MDLSQQKQSYSPYELVFDRKLNVALRDSHAREFMKRINSNNMNKDDQMLFYHMSVNNISIHAQDMIINSNIFPEIYLRIVSSDVKVGRKTTLRRSLTCINKLMTIQHDTLFKDVEDSQGYGFRPYIDDVAKTIASCKEVQRLFPYVDKMEECVKNLTLTEIRPKYDEEMEVFEKRRAHLCKQEYPDIGLKLIWSRNTVYISIDDKNYIFPRTYVLLIHNKLADILSVLLLASTYPYDFYHDDALPRTLKFIKIYLGLAKRYDSRFFHISKVLEALVIGESLAILEGENNAVFLDTVVQGIYDMSGFSYYNSELCHFFQQCSIPLLHELSCLSKIAGHPFCDIAGGADDLKTKVTEEKDVDLLAVHQSVRYAKEHFIRSFRKKHGRWPLVEIEQGARSLEMARLLNHDPRSIVHQKKYGLITLDNYDAVTLLKNMEFDWVENFLPYIKDRTISLLRSPVIQRYINEEHIKADWKSTRALLAYLLWPEAKCDHMTYLQAYIAGDWELLSDYLIIRVVPKEKEHKVKARGFGCKSLQDRARSIIQELNAAEFLSSYSEEHAMTQGELELSRKLYAYRHLVQAYTGYRMILINVDASAWNNRFRHKAVAPLMAQTLDNIYDVPIFSKTHQAYQHSFIYVPDAAKCYWWDGQEGGIEGLNQDTWVITYISQIKVCMERYPYPYHILCKGDDLRVAILVPPQMLKETPITEIKSNVLRDIAVIGSKFGHVIKVEDSYASECYFAFSKNTYINNAEMSQGYRKIQKCYGANNAFINTLDDHIASSFSNAHSTSKVCPSPLSCYFVAGMWAYFYLTKDVNFSSLDDNSLVALLLIPNVLGGFPIIYLHNFFVRAESDLLASYIHLLMHCHTSYPDIYSLMVNGLNQVWDDPDDCVVSILIDPYSLPIRKPPGASSVLRKSVVSLVERHTRNSQIRELFECRKLSFNDELLGNLKTCNVYNAKILSALYAVSPDGIITELIRKFESGRSIYELLILQSGRGFALRTLRKVKQADNKCQRYKLSLIKGIIEGSYIPNCFLNRTGQCSTEITTQLRDTMWGKPVTGITQPSIMHIMSFGRYCHFAPTLYNANNHFEYYTTYDNLTADALIFTVSSRKPFLGASTGTGLADPEVRLVAKNIFALKLHNLLDIYRWSFSTREVNGQLQTSNLPILIEDMVYCYTGKPIAEISPFTAKRAIGKTVQHHVRANQYRVSIVPNTMTNIYTRVKGYAYSHLRLKDDMNHYLYNFHQIYCHSVSLMFYNLWCGLQPESMDARYWTVTTSCSYCNAPIVDIPVIIQYTPLPIIDLSSLSEISDVALSQIRAELSDYNPGNQFIMTEEGRGFTVQDAQKALIQDFVDTSLSRYLAIREYYTQHVMSLEGRETLQDWEGSSSRPSLSISELRQMNESEIFDDMSIIIGQYIMYKHVGINLETAFTTIASAPSTDYGWMPFLKIISEAGMLFEWQIYLQRRFPNEVLTVYESYEAYAALFGYLCYLNCLRLQINKQMYLLSSSMNSYLNHTIKIRLRSYLRHLVYITETNFYSLVKNNEEMALQLAMRVVFLSFLDDMDNTQFNIDVQMKSIEKQIKMFSFLDLDEISNSMEVWEEDIDEVPLTYHVLIKLMPHLPYQQARQEIKALTRLSVTTYDSLVKEYSVHMVTLKRSDIVTCKNLIGEYQSRDSQISGLYMETLETIVQMSDPTYMSLSLIKSGRDQITYDQLSVTYERTEYDDAPDYTPNEAWRNHEFGLNNISVSRLFHLFKMLNISILPYNSSYMCFADGYGGYCLLICEMTRHSSIIFNTKPLTPESCPRPLGACAVAGGRSNHIDCQALDAGHYDITEDKFFEFLLIHMDTKHTLITCDLEMPELTSSYYRALKRVIAYALVSLHPGGLLICKIYLEDTRQVSELCGALISRCDKLFLTRSPASTGYGEAYIVAITGVHENTYENIIQRVEYPNGILVNRIHGYITYLRDFYTHMNNDPWPITLTHERSHLYGDLIRRLPCYGWSKLAEVTKVLIPPHLHIRNGKSLNQWGKDIRQYLDDIEDQYNKEASGSTFVPHQYDTLAHRIVMFLRWVQVKGARYIFRRLELQDRFYITIREILQEFEFILRKAPEMIEGTQVSYGDPYGYSIFPNDQSIVLYSHFISGVKWALSSITYGQ